MKRNAQPCSNHNEQYSVGLSGRSLPFSLMYFILHNKSTVWGGNLLAYTLNINRFPKFLSPYISRNPHSSNKKTLKVHQKKILFSHVNSHAEAHHCAWLHRFPIFGIPLNNQLDFVKDFFLPLFPCAYKIFSINSERKFDKRIELHFFSAACFFFIRSG